MKRAAGGRDTAESMLAGIMQKLELMYVSMTARLEVIGTSFQCADLVTARRQSSGVPELIADVASLGLAGLQLATSTFGECRAC